MQLPPHRRAQTRSQVATTCRCPATIFMGCQREVFLLTNSEIHFHKDSNPGTVCATRLLQPLPDKPFHDTNVSLFKLTIKETHIWCDADTALSRSIPLAIMTLRISKRSNYFRWHNWIKLNEGSLPGVLEDIWYWQPCHLHLQEDSVAYNL